MILRLRLFPLLVLAIFSTGGCRVVNGPLLVPTRSQEDTTRNLIREGLEPSLKTMTSAMSAVGTVYRASVSLATKRSDHSTDSSLVDGAKLFAPSAEDKLEYRKVSALTSVSLDGPNEGEESTRVDNGREVYDFEYTLQGAQTVAILDPDLTLKVAASGSVEVRDGQPQFLKLDVSASIYSRSASDPTVPVARFKVANLSRIGSSDAQRIEISFAEYRRLIRVVNGTNTEPLNGDSGVLELVITKEKATLTVSDVLLDSNLNLRFDSMNAVWDFTSGDFMGSAKLSFIDRDEGRFGLDINIDARMEVNAKMWKYENDHVTDPHAVGGPESSPSVRG